MEDRSVYGVENSSMFLECSPKSQRALIYWQLQKPDDDRRLEVCGGGQRSPAVFCCSAERGFLLFWVFSDQVG